MLKRFKDSFAGVLGLHTDDTMQACIRGAEAAAYKRAAAEFAAKAQVIEPVELASNEQVDRSEFRYFVSYIYQTSGCCGFSYSTATVGLDSPICRSKEVCELSDYLRRGIPDCTSVVVLNFQRLENPIPNPAASDTEGEIQCPQQPR